MPITRKTFKNKSHSHMQYLLGERFYNGQGVVKNYTKAFFHFKLAAIQEHACAQFELGMMYLSGCGISRDEEQAYYWRVRAAKADYRAHLQLLNMICVESDELIFDLSSLEEFCYESTYDDDPYAQFLMGVITINFIDSQSDLLQPIYWFGLSAKQGLHIAQYWLAIHYATGLGVPQNDAEAVFWYRKAAEQGCSKAQTCLGDRYRNGLGVEQDYTQAEAWYCRATENRNDFAKAKLHEFIKNLKGLA